MNAVALKLKDKGYSTSDVKGEHFLYLDGVKDPKYKSYSMSLSLQIHTYTYIKYECMFDKVNIYVYIWCIET